MKSPIRTTFIVLGVCFILGRCGWLWNAYNHDLVYLTVCELEAPMRYGFESHGYDVDTDTTKVFRYSDGTRQVCTTEPDRSGFERPFAPTGELRVEYELMDGQRQGACRMWDATGRLRVEGAYKTTPEGRYYRTGLWHVELDDGRRVTIWFCHPLGLG